MFERAPATIEQADFAGAARYLIRLPEEGQWHTLSLLTESLPGWPAGDALIESWRLGTTKPGKIEVSAIRNVHPCEVFGDKPAGVIQFKRSNDTRPCLYLRTPSEIEFKARVPDGGETARLSLGLVAVRHSPSVKFCLTVTSPQGTRQVMDETFDAGEWRDTPLELAGFQGQDVSFLFKADSPAPGNIALISSPILYKAQPVPSRSLNVVWYVIDCVRTDHLDVYGYEKKTAPNIASLAEEGTRFARCFSQTTWTLPSVTTMMTGVPPDTHQVGFGKEKIPKNLETVAEHLRAAGYATGSISQNPFTAPNADLDRGFDVAQQLKKPQNPAMTPTSPGDEPHVRAYSQFLDTHRHRPFFLYVHTLEVHKAPFDGKLRFTLYRSKEDMSDEISQYDEGIARADANLGRMAATLSERNLLDSTLLIVTSDHGQGFGQYGEEKGHCGRPYRGLVHVPLVMRLPSFIPAGLVVEENAQLLDIPPTILDLLKIPVPQQFQGMSLLPLFGNAPAPVYASRSIFCVGGKNEWRAMVQGGWFLFYNEGKVTLHDMAADPGHVTDLAETRRTTAEAMRAELAAHMNRQKELPAAAVPEEKDEPITIDAETNEQLKALGYLQ